VIGGFREAPGSKNDECAACEGSVISWLQTLQRDWLYCSLDEYTSTGELILILLQTLTRDTASSNAISGVV
jgi:hypothetical protein